MTVTDRILEEPGSSITGKDHRGLLQDSLVCHTTWNPVVHTVFDMVPKTNPGVALALPLGQMVPGRSLTVACSCSPGFPLPCAIPSLGSGGSTHYS
jgi:hypothetical protein